MGHSARRRNDQSRMKAKARKVYWYNKPGGGEKLANHLKACSCWMCGNPRRYFGELTIQERRAFATRTTQ